MTEATTSTNTYEDLAIGSLVETPTDPRLVRIKGAQLAIDELVRSIKTCGVLQPLVVRPKGKKTFEILAGRRRFRAAKKAGLSVVPCAIRESTDDEALMITLTENLQRRNLHPLQEAAGITQLHKKGKTVEEIASEIGFSAATVQRRLQLEELAPGVRKEFLEPESPVSRWSLRHLELVASYPIAVQERVVEDSAYGEVPVTFQELQAELRMESQDLSSAAWSLDDEDLVPEVGACANCPRRSGYCPTLFADLQMPEAKEDRCLDGDCFRKKQRAHLARTVKEGQETHGDGLVLVSDNWSVRADDHAAYGQPILDRRSRWERAKKSTKGSLPAVVVDGRDKASLLWITLPEKPKRAEGSGNAAVAVNSIEAKLKRSEGALHRKRLRHAVPALLELAEGAATPEADVLLRLISVFGGVHRCELREALYLGHGVPKSLQPKARKDQLLGPWWVVEKAPNDKALHALTWAGVRNVLSRRLDLKNAFDDLDRVEAEAGAYARLIGADWLDLWETAREVCPAPKALVKRRETVAEAG